MCHDDFPRAIYANPNLELKNMLWRELEDLALSITDNWLLARDFNDICGLGEKNGRVPFSRAKAKLFNERVCKCNQLEFELMGGRFTWKGP